MIKMSGIVFDLLAVSMHPTKNHYLLRSRVGIRLSAHAVDGKLLDVPIVSLQDRKSTGWDTGCSCDKLKETSPHFLIKVIPNDFPKPLDHYMIARKSSGVNGIFLPVINIDSW